MSKVDRFDPKVVRIGGNDHAMMYENNVDGLFVAYNDHVDAIARVEEARDKAIVVAVGRMSAETYYVLCQEIEDLKKENAALLLRIEEMSH